MNKWIDIQVDTGRIDILLITWIDLYMNGKRMDKQIYRQI